MSSAALQAERARRFEREHARRLRALAYRMLGSRADAEDMVQEAWLRWAEVDEAAIVTPAAFLTTLVTRLCLDRLRSAAVQRETYVGSWLPEPLIDCAEQWCPGPEVRTEWAQQVSMAFMLALERLSPLERAAFILHDVFDVDFECIGAELGRSAVACRQLASRARRRVQQTQVRQPLRREDVERAQRAFAAALVEGDVAALTRVLADEVRLLSDGGGRVAAVPRPLEGAARVAQVLVGFRKSLALTALRIDAVVINGSPGWLLREEASGRCLQTVSVEVDAQGRVAAVYIVRNPDKLPG
jgi:RNA polymerase sigma-70 factor (ECF subfamily)